VGRMLKAVLRWFLFAGTKFMSSLPTSPVRFPNGPVASQEKIHDLGGFDFKLLKITGPTAYANPGGIALTTNPALFGLRQIEWVIPVCGSNPAHDLSYIDSTGAMHVSVSSTGVEVANNTNLSGEFFYILAAGIR
jgi:hypothetical protein